MKSLSQEIELLCNALYGRGVKEANTKEVYNATAKTIMLYIQNDWKKYQKKDIKRCGYLSAEFLIGRLIYANMLNLKIMDEVKENLSKEGFDITQFEDVEDAALGNGGLGRLAACFLESAASVGVPLDGYGLRYRFGLFKQSFVEGFQNEEADDWLKWGDPFSNRVEDDAQIIKFAEYSVLAVPYDMPVIGYDSKTINTLRLWQSEPICDFDFKMFDAMEGRKTAIANNEATEITAVLYPNDNTEKGKMLRLKQQYFMVSASLQDVLKRYKKTGKPLQDMAKHQIWQLNDTHPTLAIPEMMRLLQIEGLTYDESFAVCQKMFNFTNHTIMGEALEKWSISMLEELIPDVLDQIILLEDHLRKHLKDYKYFIVQHGVVHMANLAIYVSSHVNGVAQIHTDILKRDTFKDWYEIYPDKFVNVTNGITPRRWLLLNNPKLAKEISNRIGDGWIKDLGQLEKMEQYVEDSSFLTKFIAIKQENKQILADYIEKHEKIVLPPTFMYDIQIKRMHEYKRQLMNAFSILYIYNGLKDGSIKNFKPTAFIFGAKSAPGYYMAKAIIKLINTIGDLVNNDSEVSDLIRVCFVENYNVSYAEKLVCAADLSEQISMAGMEASGTGNMKFMLNGTPTIGTLDGANVEICQEAGDENNYIFGATVEEVAEIKKDYHPKNILVKNPRLQKVIDSLVDGTLSDDNTNVFEAIYNSLMTGSNPDHYLVIADFESYIEAKLIANQEYGTLSYYKKCLMNMKASGKFSSDRSIQDYNKIIWNL